MDRRAYLERCAAAGLVSALAGCTDQSLEEAKETVPWADEFFHQEEVDLPVTRKFDVVTGGIQRADGETFEEPAAFEEFLGESGLGVESLEEVEKSGETVLALETVVGDALESGNSHTLGVVAGGYAALVRGGYDGEKLEASMLDPDGSRFGVFEVLTTWAEEYNEGEKSAAVYGGEVVHTLETT